MKKEMNYDLATDEEIEQANTDESVELIPVEEVSYEADK